VPGGAAPWRFGGIAGGRPTGVPIAAAALSWPNGLCVNGPPTAQAAPPVNERAGAPRRGWPARASCSAPTARGVARRPHAP